MALDFVSHCRNEREDYMYNYKIGIIDEDIADIEFIERTILINKPEQIREEQISFWRCPLPSEINNVYDSVVKSVVSKIVSDEIQALIVDYKIIISVTDLEGTEIFKKLSKIVPRFPLVMLSNMPEDCYGKEFVDADKIYSKSNFFKIDEDYSVEKVFNIFRNIDNYTSQRAKLSTQLFEQLQILGSNGYSQETLQSIIEIENLLDDFCPQEQSTIEKSLDLTNLKSAVELLEKAQKMIGENDED